MNATRRASAAVLVVRRDGAALAARHVLLDEAGVVVARQEDRMVHDLLVERDRGLDALHDELGERAAQPLDRFAAVAAPHDELGDHRVVEDRHACAPWKTPLSTRMPGPAAGRYTTISPGDGTKLSSGSSA